MKSVRGLAHVDGVDYIELPTYGGRARDKRKANLPASLIPFHPTHTVKFVFLDVTFKTNVSALDRSEAERKAVQNLRYTYWPESRLKALGPITRVIIHDA